MKRNSTTVTLTAKETSGALRKNHSETSLKKNRSSGQLVALTKLNRAHSHKNINRAGKVDGKPKRLSVQVKPREALHHTVRFDLGDDDGQEDGWTEESASQSPITTRDNTTPSSMITEHLPRPASAPIEQTETAESKEELLHPTPEPVLIPETPSPLSQPETQPHVSQLETQPFVSQPETSPPVSVSEKTHSSETPPAAVPQSIPQPSGNKPHALRQQDADRITSRLLNRNVSLTALPKVSEVSAAATVIGDGHKSKSSLRSQSSGLTEESNGSGLVSRFVNGTSSSATPRESHFPPSQHENQEDEDHVGMLRNMSTANVTRAQSRVNIEGAPPTAPLILPPSRTQQKMWLERASSTIEPQQTRPMRVARLGSGFPFHNIGGEGGIHPIMRTPFEQTDVEYRRIRIYQNPLRDAIVRLQKSGALSKPKIPQKTVGRSALANSDAKHNTNATEKESRAPKPSDGTVPSKRAKVSFQGITREGQDSRRSSNGEEEEERIRQKEEAREICRRLWERHDLAGEE